MIFRLFASLSASLFLLAGLTTTAFAISIQDLAGAANLTLGPNNYSYSADNVWCIPTDTTCTNVNGTGKSYALTTTDNNDYRFEIRPGDHYCDRWYCDENTRERDQVLSQTIYPPTATIDINYDFMIEPGPVVTSNWSTYGVFHGNNTVAFENVILWPGGTNKIGDRMAVDIGQGGNNNYIYQDPNPIQRGHWYTMSIQFHQSSSQTATDGWMKEWRAVWTRGTPYEDRPAGTPVN